MTEQAYVKMANGQFARKDTCPNCHRVGYYWNLPNNRRQCRGPKCLTMWAVELADV